MKEEMIHIGSVNIPLLDYAVSCSAILGIRDSGKTVTAKGIAEQLLDHDIPIIVFDAVGKWRWMKVPGPGPRGRGYKVVVAGGKKPDLALNPHSVGEIVRSAVKEKIPLIIDLYDPNLSKAQWRSIVKESIRIVHYEAVGVAHIFLEEAAEFIPQKPTDFDTYAEVEKLARMGGNASVGITLISQRAQEVNKAVLDLAVNLILGCQVGSKAIEWIGKWLDRLSPETSKAVTTSLPKLKSGEAWVWTRSNLDEPLREQMSMCRSLHPDRRTPEVELKSAKAVDPEKFVERLKIAIPKIIEEAKAKDPREWEKQKRELNARIKQLESAKPAAVASAPKIVYALKDGQIATVEKLLAQISAVPESFREKLERATLPLKEALAKVSVNGHKPMNATEVTRDGPLVTRRPVRIDFPRVPRSTPQRAESSAGELSAPEQKILDTVLMLNTRGIVASRDSVARWLGIHPNGGRYGSNLAALRANDYLDGFTLTEKGAQQTRPMATGIVEARAALKDDAQRRILDVLQEETGFSRDSLAEKLGIHPNGGRYGSNLAWMRTMGLIPERGTIELTEGAWR